MPRAADWQASRAASKQDDRVHFLISVLFAASLVTGLGSSSGGPPEHVHYGFIAEIRATSLLLRRHDGRLEAIDIAPARAAGLTGVLYVNRPVAVYGELDRLGRYHAESIRSWYALRRGIWPADS